MKWLLKFINPYYALFLSAFLFGVMHRNPSHIVNATLMGILLGVIYLSTRSVYPCIIVHFLHNLLCTIFCYLYPQDYDQYLIEYSRVNNVSIYDLAGIVFFVLGIVLFILFKKNKTHAFQQY